MAKIAYTEIMGASAYFSSYYDVDTLDVASHSSSKAVYEDRISHYRIILKGSDIVVDDGTITAGTIEQIKFVNDDGAALINISHGEFNAHALDAALDKGGFSGLMKKIFSGNDNIIGSKLADDLWGGIGNNHIRGGDGRDYISGGTGNDILTGGKGADVFLFNGGSGQDVITDFDAVGGGQKQDHIALVDGTEYEIRASGSDTVIDFGGGHTLTLLAVERADVTQADFMQLA